jgi:fatty acid amide hydrolase 2
MYSWLVVPVRILRILIDFLTNLIYGWIYEGDRVTRLPPIQDVVLLDPATVLADKIRTQKITSVEVLEVYFKRINEVNGDINCLVDSR